MPVEGVGQNRIKIQPDRRSTAHTAYALLTRLQRASDTSRHPRFDGRTSYLSEASLFAAHIQTRMKRPSASKLGSIPMSRRRLPGTSIFVCPLNSIMTFRRKYPKISLKLRAPIELENLLPYNIEYRIYDKNADQNWRSYLRKGGVMPVHSVELGHMVLLNVTVQDTGTPPSSQSLLLAVYSTQSSNRATFRLSTLMVVPTLISRIVLP